MIPRIKQDLETTLMDSLKNKRICDQTIIEPPAQILEQYPITPHATTFIAQAREQIDRIVRGEDHRLLVICGPCSLHDIDAAKEYAQRLRDLHWQYSLQSGGHCPLHR